MHYSIDRRSGSRCHRILHQPVYGVLVLLLALTAAGDSSTNSDNNASRYTMFGLHNGNGSESLVVANAFNAWIHNQAMHSSKALGEAPRIVSLQEVAHYLMMAPGDATDQRNSDLLATLTAIWNNDSIPLLQLLPCQDPDLDPIGFAATMAQASSQAGGRTPAYNTWLLEAHPTTVEGNVSQFVHRVLLPFLFPAATSSVFDPLWLLNGGGGYDGTNGTLLASSRRLYLEFAPAFNSHRYPWGASYALPTAAPGGGYMVIRNPPESYAQLWSRVVGSGIQAALQSWMLLALRTTAVGSRMANHDAAGEATNQGGAEEALRLNRFLQVVWTASATQVSTTWAQNGSLVAPWLPSWPCPSATALCSVVSSVCGPDWFAVTAVALDTDGAEGTDSVALVGPMLTAVKALSDEIHEIAAWCRAPELQNVSVPVALLHVGAASEASTIDSGGGPQRKDEWIHSLLNLAFDDAYIRLVVPQNTKCFANNPLGTSPMDAHLQVYSFGDGDCCDGTDPANGAAVMDQVSAVLIDAEAAGLLVEVQRVVQPRGAADGGACVACRILTDATFMGASYSGSACSCAPTNTDSPAHEGWLVRVVKDPVVIAGAAVVVAVLVGICIAWCRRRAQTSTMQQRRRMILGRYVVTSILQHYRQFSSVLVAYDTVQCMDVVVKQYVLVSDNAIALANNEIEKYRACTGFPHVVQLVQCTFAWKKKQLPRQGGGSVSDRRGTRDTGLLQDPSSLETRELRERTQSANSNGYAVLNDANAAKTPFAIVVMKKYASGDLKAMIDRVKEDSGGDRSLDPHTGFGYADSISLLTQLCLALHTIHSVLNPDDALLHRDVKPENIFLERRPLKGKPKEHVYIAYLGDFGCAVYESQLRNNNAAASCSPTTQSGGQHDSGASATTSRQQTDISDTYLTTKAVGTSKYMPPEARRGKYCPAGDIWALGCVMLFAALRHVPTDYCHALIDDGFVRTARSTLSGHALFPAWLTDMVLHRMLHVDPTCRSTAEEVLKTIRREVTASPVVDAALLHRQPIDEAFGDPSPTAAEASACSARYLPMDVEVTAGGRPPAISDGRFSLVGGDEDIDGSDDENLILDDADIAETADHFV